VCKKKGDSMSEQYKHSELTDQIINAFYHVYNDLGYGFLENVYQNALIIELNKAGLTGEKQKQIRVFYQNEIVGDYKADIVVNDIVILELKSVDHLIQQHENQLINYLKATNIEVGLLLNFGMKPEVRRKIYDNDKKRLAHR
jgi:GxxExxY protein